MARTSGVIEFAILGLLHDSPMHGYELRKRLSAELGAFRAFSYGSLYPALKGLVSSGLITEDVDSAASGGVGRRSKIVYKLTAEGKERFQSLVSEAGPSAWEDDSFSVHLAFFARTDSDVRLRILEGRRSRLEERLDTLRSSLRQAGQRVDTYTQALQNHGLESVEREVRWLNELILTERSADADSLTLTESADTGSRTRTTARQDAPVDAGQNKE